MGSRMADSVELIKRVQAVGWRTERGTRGWKVYNDRGQMFTIHLTYSDRRSLLNNIADLERGGLREAETNMAEVKFQAANERTVRGRKAAATRAANIAAKAAENGNMLAKAAGPYFTEPETVGILWFAEKHPAPQFKWVWMTPEIAQYLLDQHNTLNRPINPRQVEHYKNIILSGQWHMTHQGGAMDTDAVLQDSQHRLTALLEAAEATDNDDLRIPMAFFVGMPTENFAAIDEGLLRTASQLFARGSEKNGSTLQTAIRLVVAYQDQNPRGRYRLKTTNEQILHTFDRDPELFREAASIGQSHGRKAWTATGSMAAANWLLRHHNGADNKFVTAFFEGLLTGRKAGTRMALDDDDPRAVYRETMQTAKVKGKRITGMDQVAMIILSWNNVVNNYSPRYLRYADDAPIPRIVVCQDEGPNASACPKALLGEFDGEEHDE